MIKKISLCYIIASIITIFIMIVETTVRSPLLSPLLLINETPSYEETNGRVLTGHSSIQGDYFLSINYKKSLNSELMNPSFKFQLLNNDYAYYSLDNTKQIIKENQTYEVITRSGIKISIDDQTNLENKQTFFTNHYFIESEKLKKINYELNFSNWIVAISTLLSIIIPPIMFLAYRYFVNRKHGIENIFLIFAPYLLSILLPLIVNYHFLINFLLLHTASYLISIIVSIFLPILLSSILTIKAGEYYSKAIINYKKENNYYYEPPKNDEEQSSNREGHKFVVLLNLLILYFSLYFILPLSFQAIVINNLFLFSIWFISVTILVFIISSLLHNYTGNYKRLNKDHELNNFIKNIEKHTSLVINVYIKRHSLEESNAWVYSINFRRNKSLNIFITEGLLENFTEEEISSILYHEIGHIRLNHGQYILLLSLLVSALTSILLFYARQLMLSYGWWQYFMVLPFGAIFLILITEWLPKKISKIFEHKADEYAVQGTNNKELYIQTLLKLERLNKTEQEYKVKQREWKSSHPTLQKRINYLERKF